MIGKLYKTIASLLIASLLLLPNNALATNTYSTDLELSSSQYWSITDAAQTGLDITGDISIELWINLEQLPSTGSNVFVLVDKYETGKRSYQLLLLSDNTLRWTVFQDEVPHYNRVVTTSAFVSTGDVGKWVHVAATSDTSAGASGMVMYKNGSPVSDSDVNSDATSIQNSSATVGIGSQLNTAYTDGKIDDVRIWNDVRTPEEISANYNCSLQGNEDNLVAYWRFDNDGNDSTSNDNDLTNNNSCTFQSASLPFTNTCGVVEGWDYSYIIEF